MPAETGPMKGSFDAKGLQMLQELKSMVNKELDACQVGGPSNGHDIVRKALEYSARAFEMGRHG